ncbi:protein mono-ADP-ribosyltransferase PARP14-like isoform X1 [Mytilus galloprovincialis]|uniref:protein mono-ADP-ribosyltransferase PARP14-like isoform X1 n=2 Tax=Mytilus galloprovincialis TaxID=29158 RepID=UPI003F7BC9B4
MQTKYTSPIDEEITPRIGFMDAPFATESAETRDQNEYDYLRRYQFEQPIQEPLYKEHEAHSETHSETQITEYEVLVQQLENSQGLMHCKADGNVEVLRQLNGKIKISGPKDVVFKTKSSIVLYLRKLEKAEEVSQYVEWGFSINRGKVKPFDKILNYELETKYKDNVQSTAFDHYGTLMFVDYTSMHIWYDGDDAYKYKISRIIKDSVSFNVGFPSSWTHMELGVQCTEEKVDSGDEIFNFIQKKFWKADRNIKILQILRVQNRHLFSQFNVKQKELQQKNGTDSELLLWHGTSKDCIDKIINNGFNRSYCGRNGTAYGKGVYFAVKLRLSLKYTSTSSGIGHMFLATVEVGESCEGYRNMPVLPPRRECASHITYDSACDDPYDPYMFVLFNDIQAYPSYHIAFRYHNW